MGGTRCKCGKCHEVVSDIVNSKDGFTLPKDVLGLWEQTVCEIRSEIKNWDLIGPHTKQHAKELCDKLEHSMCAIAGGPYSLKYSIE